MRWIPSWRGEESVDGVSANVVWCNESATESPIAYLTDARRQVIGTNYSQVQNRKIVDMSAVHDSLPYIDQSAHRPEPSCQ